MHFFFIIFLYNYLILFHSWSCGELGGGTGCTPPFTCRELGQASAAGPSEGSVLLAPVIPEIAE